MLSALSFLLALSTLSAVRLDIRTPKTYLKEAESNYLPYLQDDFLVELLEFKKFGQPNGFFVGTEPTTKLDSRFSRSISLIVGTSGYEALRGYVYAKHKPSELLPLYTTGENDVGILSTNKSEVHLSYLLGYCSPKLGYFGATVPLFGEFDGPLTLNPLSGRDNNCQYIRKALCYGWAKTARYHVKDLLTAEDTMETLTYSKLSNSFVPLMPTNPDSVTTCAQLGSTLNQVDVKNGLGRICGSLVPLYSLRNKKWSAKKVEKDQSKPEFDTKKNLDTFCHQLRA
uniref:Metalloprotease n=1 Tax=Bursaphelenchus xylophilus TaxID=6326 RepID=A0A1I7SEX1_BURXY